MGTQFTPGPWRVRFDRSGDWMEGIQGAPEGSNQYGEMVINRGIAKPKSERGLANARLIAAAPDLLAALDVLADRQSPHIAHKNALAALAKATGR